jgi:hypothetical protein
MERSWRLFVPVSELNPLEIFDDDSLDATWSNLNWKVAGKYLGLHVEYNEQNVINPGRDISS